MTEKKIILKHAGTVLLGQIAVVAFGVTDTVIAGRYEPQALAVLSVSSAIYISVYVSLLGVIQALLPIFAELFGAKKLESIGYHFRQALYIWLILSILGAMILLSPYFLLHLTQVPESVQPYIQTYLGTLAIAIPAALFFRLYSSLNQSIGKPRLITWIQISALIVKIPLSILLTFGTTEYPGLGILGCALATVIVSYLMCFVAIWLLHTNEIYKSFQVWCSLEKPDLVKLMKMVKLGIPNGFSVLVEVTSFTLMALFIARLGTMATASHQIAANMTALIYMIPLSFSIAVSARLSYWIGAKNNLNVLKVIRIGFQVIILESTFIACILFLFSDSIADLYAKDESVKQVAAKLLILVGFFHVGDAIQTLCFFILRSFKIALLPFIVYGTMLWGIGLTGGYFLAYKGLGMYAPMESPEAFWIMSVIALAFVCICLIYIIIKNLPKNKITQD
jgi:MATE family multidrug resistance protein